MAEVSLIQGLRSDGWADGLETDVLTRDGCVEWLLIGDVEEAWHA